MVVLIALLAVIDGRVREQFTGNAPDGIWDHITHERGHLNAAATTAVDLITAHEALTTFVVAGSVLVACMLRT
jgi:hypothetical protein